MHTPSLPRAEARRHLAKLRARLGCSWRQLCLSKHAAWLCGQLAVCKVAHRVSFRSMDAGPWEPLVRSRCRSSDRSGAPVVHRLCGLLTLHCQSRACSAGRPARAMRHGAPGPAMGVRARGAQPALFSQAYEGRPRALQQPGGAGGRVQPGGTQTLACTWIGTDAIRCAGPARVRHAAVQLVLRRLLVSASTRRLRGGHASASGGCGAPCRSQRSCPLHINLSVGRLL